MIPKRQKKRQHNSDGQPLVSVIMNCLNGEEYLEEAIDSVYGQSYGNWEIIFWDNASTDMTEAIAKGYDERLLYFRSERTLPLSVVRNYAFAEANGDYIAILDCDDIWLPEKIEKQMALFQSNPLLGMTYSNTIFFNATSDGYEMFKVAIPKKGWVFGDLLARNFISSETMMFRKTALDSLEYLFNDELFYVMDYDLTLRLAYLFEVDFVEEPLSKWRMHEKSESFLQRFKIPYENERMLDALLRWSPEIGEDYLGEVELFRKAVRYDLALEAWFKGDKAKSRMLLKPHIFDKKHLITFVAASLIPFSWYERIKPLIQKLRLHLKS